MLDTSARLLRLLTHLQTHRDWSAGELADRLEVTERTVRRDVDRLRTLGYPVDAQPGPGGGYRLGAGAVLPPLLLDDDDAVAVAVALRGAALSGVAGLGEHALQALGKLERVLPSRLRHRLQLLDAAVVQLTGPSGGTQAAVEVDVLLAVAEAVRDHRVLRVDYADRAGVATRREIEPHRIVQAGRRWYVVAWDLGRDDWRTLRLDRLTPRIPPGPRFTPRPAPPAGPAAYTADAITTSPYRWRCRITLHTSAEVAAGHLSPSVGVLTPVDDEHCTLVAGANTLEEAALWIGLVGVPFVVHEPVELRTTLARLGALLADAATAVP